MQELRDELARREAAGLYRRRRTVDGPQGPVLSVDGSERLAFCSNDYLGLANHPAVIAAFQRAAGVYGVGSGAAHLVAGHQRPHQALEEELAAFTGYPRALRFSTGQDNCNIRGPASIIVNHVVPIYAWQITRTTIFIHN